MLPTAPHPPSVEIPPEALLQGQLASFLARSSLHYGPIFTVRLKADVPQGGDIVYLVGPEANKFVLFTHRKHFSNSFGWTPVFGPALGKGLINMDPPDHPRYRAVMNPAFTIAFVDEFLPTMHRIIEDRTRDWVHRGEIDLVVESREIAFDIAAAVLLGVDCGDDADFLRERFYQLVRQPQPGEGNWVKILLTLGRIRTELDRKLVELIAARRQRNLTQRPRNVLDMLIDARDEQGNPFSDEQLLGHINILLVAGHETTTNLSAWLLYLLSVNTEYGARVAEELSDAFADEDMSKAREALHSLPALTNALFEAGRLHPPVMFLPRGVVKPFEFGGYTIAAGTSALLAIAASHRLPTVFESPDTFDPDRFLPPREEHKRHPYALATFGGGPRTCLGINLADTEIKSLVAHVWPRYRLAPIPGKDIEQVDALIHCLPKGIHMSVSPI
jgi:cytochrome P450